jgi:hypothetical protein
MSMPPLLPWSGVWCFFCCCALAPAPLLVAFSSVVGLCHANMAEASILPSALAPKSDGSTAFFLLASVSPPPTKELVENEGLTSVMPFATFGVA